MDDLVDYAFRRASKVTARTPQELALKKVFAVRDSATSKLTSATKKREYTPFERALLETDVDFVRVRKEASRARTTCRLLTNLADELEIRIKHAPRYEATRQLRAFYGRSASMLKRIRLDEIEKLHWAERSLPKLRDMPTAIIAGCPNVGKSQLLRQLTGSRVQVAPYPFTTKEILVGVAKHKYAGLQLVDTPGLLDRPAEKRNAIERKAITALKFLSNRIIFVLDPSETCGYPIAEQLHLLEELKKEFSPHLFVVAAKRDLAAYEGADIEVNLLDEKECANLKEALFRWAR